MASKKNAIPVTADNFVRAESDNYFGVVVHREDALGKFNHHRAVTPVDHQNVIRSNRDTLYSVAIFDLDAGPVTITLPDAGGRYMALQVITQDHYTLTVIYKSGSHTFTRKQAGTRYILTGIRTLVDPADPNDLRQAHALQDAIQVEQKGHGELELPTWDQESQDKVRSALLTLASTLPDTKGMFGAEGEVNPIHHLIGAAFGWGGNPEKDALYLNVTPHQNDGKTIYRLNVKDVPVDGFWSISLYNAEGYYEPNDAGAYALNNITAKRDADGSITIQFGGCNGDIPNCLPIMPGWNYTVRLYRPRAEILDGTWTFPEPQPVS